MSTSIFFFFKFVVCAVQTDKNNGRQMLSKRLGFLIILIIRLSYQHSELHKSRSQRGAAPSPPLKKSKTKNFHPQTLAAHI